VGIHSASDTEHSWPWYVGLVGSFFLSHPAIQNSTITVEDLTNPSTFFVLSTWQRIDEGYNFDHNLRGVVHVLVTVDESTYSGGTMGARPPYRLLPNLRGRQSLVYGRQSHVAKLFRAVVPATHARWCSIRDRHCQCRVLIFTHISVPCVVLGVMPTGSCCSETRQTSDGRFPHSPVLGQPYTVSRS